ncbi:hypothetical protein [Rhizobium ruizarguesonis]|uniref:hypothetical protein n=1 Tax=Rhizobium ruizarguesonis TaxID=2081791 RepID=UPI0010311DD6|nr:hypothetical protein [Rhizobium ruizarguesonis]TBE99678.1 hypothetical protein ELG98_25395 [Rhizobium ruizarguesonis]
MGERDVQLVLEDLVAKPSSQKAFKSDSSAYLAQFNLTDGEKSAFGDLSVDCLVKTAAFINKFSDAELSIGSLWIKDQV